MRTRSILTVAAALLLAGACAPPVPPPTKAAKNAPAAKPTATPEAAKTAAPSAEPAPAPVPEKKVLPPDVTVEVPPAALKEEPLAPPKAAGGVKPKSPSMGGVGTIGHGSGLGLSGTGVGGTGVGYGKGHGRLGRSHRAKPPRVRMGSTSVSGRAARPRPAPRSTPSGAVPSGGVKAGEWDDNANYREFMKYLTAQSGLGHTKLDVSHRRFIVVRDVNGRPVPSCDVEVRDKLGHRVELTTTGSGRAILFPNAESLEKGTLVATASCQSENVVIPFSSVAPDGVVDLKLKKPRVMPNIRTIDIAFVLDTTGSMGEEIAALKKTLRTVSKTLAGMNVRIRVGLVEYRDRQDAFLTRLHQMTTDITGFDKRIDTLKANGGGDMPEDVNEGIRIAVEQLNWKKTSVARLAFLIGDAPPQLSYQNATSYAASMKRAQKQGVQIFTIAASGMDPLGQVVWRQIAQYTGGTNMFVLRGGAGPQSTGGGDPKKSCGGTHDNYRSGNLAQLITDKVKLELAAVDGNPMRIAGLHKDEKAKPCKQRVKRMAKQ